MAKPARAPSPSPSQHLLPSKEQQKYPSSPFPAAHTQRCCQFLRHLPLTPQMAAHTHFPEEMFLNAYHVLKWDTQKLPLRSWLEVKEKRLPREIIVTEQMTRQNRKHALIKCSERLKARSILASWGIQEGFLKEATG